MNKLIQDELKKVQVADLSNYSEGVTEFIIPKTVLDKFEVGQSYIIELDDSLIKHNPESVLETNYNSGKIPSNKYYYIEVSAVLGKLIKCVGMAFDVENNMTIGTFWNGYFPINCIKILKKGDSLQ